jgi:hypothetical protein
LCVEQPISGDGQFSPDVAVVGFYLYPVTATKSVTQKLRYILWLPQHISKETLSAGWSLNYILNRFFVADFYKIAYLQRKRRYIGRF